MFKTFLRSEYSEENMLFWMACEELKHESIPDVVEEKARSIYDDYISILSPKEVFIVIILCILYPITVGWGAYENRNHRNYRNYVRIS